MSLTEGRPLRGGGFRQGGVTVALGKAGPGHESRPGHPPCSNRARASMKEAPKRQARSKKDGGAGNGDFVREARFQRSPKMRARPLLRLPGLAAASRARSVWRLSRGRRVQAITIACLELGSGSGCGDESTDKADPFLPFAFGAMTGRRGWNERGCGPDPSSRERSGPARLGAQSKSAKILSLSSRE